jgi:hypothetical protein
MLWRLGEASAADGKAPLVFDDVKHQLRCGEGAWVPLARNPALVLSLLVRMQARGRSVPPRELCAYLELPEGTRVSGHVAELRKKIAECGVAPESVIDNIGNHTGYQLTPGMTAAPLVEADELKVLDELLSGRRIPRRKLRAQLLELRGMLLVCSAVTVMFTTYAVLRAGEGVEVVQLTPEEGGPTSDRIEYRTCFELARELGLGERGVLALTLSVAAKPAPTHVAITLERELRAAGHARFELPLGSGEAATVRIEGAKIDSGLRAHARRICVEDAGDSPGQSRGSSGISLRELRIE